MHRQYTVRGADVNFRSADPSPLANLTGSSHHCQRLSGAALIAGLSIMAAIHPTLSVGYTYPMITESEIQPIEPSASESGGRSFMSKLLGGEFGLAVTYWLLFFLGAGSFFIFGTGAKAGSCWHELSSSEECPEGFEVDEYNFYKLSICLASTSSVRHTTCSKRSTITTPTSWT